jgi:hypothetical protein
VSDLFRSVQLNVNNPHFLIMQGRITKVLNMKPPEILAMIEEAAGTRFDNFMVAKLYYVDAALIPGKGKLICAFGSNFFLW